jgi:hypothetical protein
VIPAGDLALPPWARALRPCRPLPELPANWNAGKACERETPAESRDSWMAAGTYPVTEARPSRHCPDAWRIWHEAGADQPDMRFIQQAASGPTSVGHNRSAPNHTSTKRNSGTVCHSWLAASTAEGRSLAVI